MTSTLELIERRNSTIGPYSPLFYNEPLQFVSAKGVWFTDVNGDRYLDGYNNVPHVGHCNDRVIRALTEQASTLNVHTRYLNDRVVNYAERLLATFDDRLDRVFFTNSGSEANELAIRIARQHTGAKGMIVSDFSYHGNTITLAELTTGLDAREALADHVRAIRIPDLDIDQRPEAEVLESSLSELDAAIESLQRPDTASPRACSTPCSPRRGCRGCPRASSPGSSTASTAPAGSSSPTRCRAASGAPEPICGATSTWAWKPIS